MDEIGIICGGANDEDPVDNTGKRGEQMKEKNGDVYLCGTIIQE